MQISHLKTEIAQCGFKRQCFFYFKTQLERHYSVVAREHVNLDYRS